MTTATSIHAYRTLDLPPACDKVAREILRLTKAGKPAWIGGVAKILGLEKSSVAGRFNDLKNLYPDGIPIDGRRYQMEQLKKRAFDEGTGKWVEAWALILFTAPVDSGQQIKMEI